MNLLYSYFGPANTLINSVDSRKINTALITIASMVGMYPVYYIVSNGFMYVFDYKYIHINDWQFVSNISPHIDYSTILTARNHKCGYIASKTLSIFGYLYVNDNCSYFENSCGGGYSNRGYVFISNKCLTEHKLLEEKSFKVIKYDTNKKYCKIYNSSGTSYAVDEIRANNIHWHKTPTMLQSIIMNQIIDYHSKNITHNCVVLLSGTIGTGKSMLCRLLAEKMNASIYDEYQPNQAAYYSFDGIVNVMVKPTIKEPLIIVLEEIDVIIDKIHNKPIEQNDYRNIPVKNKTDWNNFLDRIDYGQYPNVILIMTTNKPRAWFDALDPSYMREGRVNLHIDIDAIAAATADEDITYLPNKDKVYTTGRDTAAGSHKPSGVDPFFPTD